MAKLLKDNGLTLVLLLMFAGSLVGQWLSGWQVENEDLRRHGAAAIGAFAYLTDPAFISAVFENWESEFLQMSVYVVLTAMLVQRGSAESRDPDEPERDPGRANNVFEYLYAHSLGLALAGLFVASFVMHWTFSAKMAAQEAVEHGEAARSMIGYLADPELWFESFQNWQSEFLSTAVLVVLSIFLRYRNSPESKAMTVPNSQTGD